MFFKYLEQDISYQIEHQGLGAYSFNNTIMAYSIIERGCLYSPDYRMYFRNGNGPISPIHDIGLFVNPEGTILHMIVEIPRWTNAKMEISMDEPLNPIKQCTKNGKPRFVANCFPHRGYMWNYGALPQTWEDPHYTFFETGHRGNNDPLDVIEIGQRVAKLGEVLKVKVLGMLAMISEGETDWKVIAIDVNDPLSDKLTSIPDIHKYFPELLQTTVDWFKIYKVPDGKREKIFALRGEAFDADYACRIIKRCHENWVGLNQMNAKRRSLLNTTFDINMFGVGSDNAQNIIDRTPCYRAPGPIDAEVDKVHFVRHLGSKLNYNNCRYAKF